VVVPPLLHYAFVPDTAGWAPLGIWGLQVLVFSLLLGLIAGDLDALWRSGLGLSDLRELYSLRFLITLASSILITGGATTATWIATGVTVATALLGQGEAGPPGNLPPKQ